MMSTALYTKKPPLAVFFMVPTERLVLVRKCCKQHQLTSVTAVVTLKSIAVACFFTNNSVTCGKNRQLLLAIFILVPTHWVGSSSFNGSLYTKKPPLAVFFMVPTERLELPTH